MGIYVAVTRLAGDYFTAIEMDKAYSQNGQMVTLKKIFGSATLAAKYIDVIQKYFTKGHLAPDGDFIDSSYNYIHQHLAAVAIFQQRKLENSGNCSARVGRLAAPPVIFYLSTLVYENFINKKNDLNTEFEELFIPK